MWIKFLWQYKTQLLSALLAAFITFKITSFFNEIDKNHAVSTAMITAKQVCEKEKEITRNVSKQLNKSLNDNSSKLIAINDRLRSENRECVLARTPRRNDGTSEGTGVSNQVGENAVAADEVTRLFYEADNTTSKLLACQTFICKVYDINGRKLNYPVCK